MVLFFFICKTYSANCRIIFSFDLCDVSDLNLERESNELKATDVGSANLAVSTMAALITVSLSDLEN